MPNAIFDFFVQQRGYTETVILHTHIARAESGQVYTTSIQSDHKTQIKLNPLIKDTKEQRRLQALIAVAVDTDIYVPKWWSLSKLTGPVAGDNISCVTTSREFVVADQILLFSITGALASEFHPVDTINPASIDLTGGSAPGAFVTGDYCLPLITGRLNNKSGYRTKRDRFGKTTLTFMEM